MTLKYGSQVFKICGLLAVLTYVVPAIAQPAPKFTVEAVKAVRLPNGNVRLEGKAHINSPQIDVRANIIEVDTKGNRITQVRARTKVAFKLNLPPREGNAATQVEATCDSATLDPALPTLLLNGNVNGWYQTAGSSRNTLSGDSATLKYAGKILMAEVNGGTRPLTISIPPEKDSPASIGTVTLTAQRAIHNGSTGTTTFTGQARAVSTDGPNKFDVAAPEFVLTRNTAGAIDNLQTSGRTRIKLDLPPEAATTDATPTATATGALDTNPGVGRPTHLEAEADSVIVRRVTNTVDFQGNVKGFYELSAPDVPAAKYDFTGDRVAIKYVTKEEASATNPVGLKVEMSGVPVQINAPGWDLNF